ncbi:hypothetical protein PV773_06770 [Mesorhizobium sp. CC13]
MAACGAGAGWKTRDIGGATPFGCLNAATVGFERSLATGTHPSWT